MKILQEHKKEYFLIHVDGLKSMYGDSKQCWKRAQALRSLHAPCFP